MMGLVIIDYRPMDLNMASRLKISLIPAREAIRAVSPRATTTIKAPKIPSVRRFLAVSILFLSPSEVK